MSTPSIFIRNCTTKKLYCNQRTWTKRQKHARAFESALTAYNFVADENLNDVEIVWLRPEGGIVQPIFEAHRPDARFAGYAAFMMAMQCV